MPQISINGHPCEFEDGQSILEVALAHETEIPHYCWHPGLSVVASCRICLVEVWAPNPRNDNKLEAIPKLLPACQTPASDGQVVHTDSPKAVGNQRSVMEYLLINHPVDCPVCDQAGECTLQDYAYRYGRAGSRFEEEKLKQSKKDLGPNILLYGDRCIMCSRCVRFTREVTGTGELMVSGRGANESIDVFPGIALDNELSGNVIDLCPVGALLDKDFLFQQRVWYLTRTPSIDGVTSGGDNISVEHNHGTIFRIKPRTNLEVNQWWISDEIRWGWKFIHDDARRRIPAVRGHDAWIPEQADDAWSTALSSTVAGLKGRRIGVLISPMLACEDAWHLARMARQMDPEALLALGPVPRDGEDKTFPGGYTVRAEKAPNARGIRRVLEACGGATTDAAGFEAALSAESGPEAVVLTGNYPSAWVTESFADVLGDRFVVLIDTMPNRLETRCDVFMPAATWVEKSGTFENVDGRLQAFERAIDPIDYCKSEAQVAMDVLALHDGVQSDWFNAAMTRQAMSVESGLKMFLEEVHMPEAETTVESDMEVIEL
jgi:NADH-quinone oxidoreductase subunit G